MIPRANITAWRGTAPWPDNAQVEQDLVLARALVEMFRRESVAEQIISAFERYVDFGGTPVTRAQFEASMAPKLTDQAFLDDVSPLLRTGLAHDPAEAWGLVNTALVAKLPGRPWKGEGE